MVDLPITNIDIYQYLKFKFFTPPTQRKTGASD
jgi:hypothetical protein